MNVQYAKSDLSIGYLLVLLGLLCPAVRTGQAWLWQDVDYLLSRKTNPDVKGDPLSRKPVVHALIKWNTFSVVLYLKIFKAEKYSQHKSFWIAGS